MKFPLFPINEMARIADLYTYHCLDSQTEGEFDQITKITCALFNTPIALISLIDYNRQWFKSKVGIEASETSRETSICAHAILEDGVFEVPDISHDERFKDNPLLYLNGFKFYAGAPLISTSNHKLGTLCIIDNKPRKLNEQDKKNLLILSAYVVELMEVRKQQIDKQCEELELMGLKIVGRLA